MGAIWSYDDYVRELRWSKNQHALRFEGTLYLEHTTQYTFYLCAQPTPFPGSQPPEIFAMEPPRGQCSRERRQAGRAETLGRSGPRGVGAHQPRGLDGSSEP